MARAQQRQSQPPPQPDYRTAESRRPSGEMRRPSGEMRKPSGFLPAQRTVPPQQDQPPRVEYRDQEEEESAGPLTKSGYPDRRFRGQRDLPPPPTEESGTRARTGGTIGDMHITIEGKPDRRFKENRQLSEEELNAKWLEEMNARYGR